MTNLNKLVLASANPGKIKELQEWLDKLGITIVPQVDLGIPDIEETGLTFVENAILKARNASALSNLPAIADDAGLCVDAFGGLPGVQTAFYCTQFGYPKSDDNNRKALLEQMVGITQRRAALVSTLVAVRSPQDPEPLIATGRAVGESTTEPLGDKGFGFDPVMWIPSSGKTFAQMPEQEKNALSHRGQAAKAMLELMQSRWFS